MGASDWLNREEQVYNVGDPVWVIVDDVNSPTGRWRGEISVSEDRLCYDRMVPHFEVKLTDPRLEKEMHYGRSWLGQTPTVNYRVLPRTPYIDRAFELLSAAEEATRNTAYRARVREEAFKEAIAAAAGKK